VLDVTVSVPLDKESIGTLAPDAFAKDVASSNGKWSGSRGIADRITHMSQAHCRPAGYREGRRNRWIVRGDQGHAGCGVDNGSEERVAAENNGGVALPVRVFASENVDDPCALRWLQSRENPKGIVKERLLRLYRSERALRLCRAGDTKYSGNPETVQDHDRSRSRTKFMGRTKFVKGSRSWTSRPGRLVRIVLNDLVYGRITRRRAVFPDRYRDGTP
jgi:hypothetical protein